MTVLDMSAGGAVLIAAVLLLRRSFLHRLPKWTFLLLWAAALCRLLVPLSVPSPLSVYNAAERAVQALQRQEETPARRPVGETPSAPAESQVILQPLVPQKPAESPAPPTAPEAAPERISPLKVIYFTGAALCGLFFIATYLRSLSAFRGAEAVDNELLAQWRAEHPRPRVRFRCSGAVSAPLTYGLLRPVILFPDPTNWNDEAALRYALAHEYVHIRRRDVGWKLLLAAALCVHWFNPLVWAMYLCANRDLELACDEAVVRSLGMENRRGYALSLLSAETTRGHFLPLCSGYSGNQTEERILAIMKIKRRSLTAALAALVLVAGTVAVFATGPVSGRIQPVRRPTPPDISQLEPARSSVPVLPDQKLEPVPTQTAPSPAVPESEHAAELTTEPAAPVTAPAEPEAAPTQPKPADSEPDLLDLIIEARRAEWDAIEIIPCPDLSQLSDEDLWQVPHTEIPVSSHQEEEALRRYLEEERGLDDITYRYNYAVNTRYVCISYTQALHREEARRALLPDGTYPVNSRGESYGSYCWRDYAGYDPDLISARASNGENGYLLYNDFQFSGYPGNMDLYKATAEEWAAYTAWMEAQPSVIQLPVYDVERNNIVGYYEHYNNCSLGLTRSPEEIQEEKDDVTRMLQWQGYSEEEIAETLEKLAESHGW